MTHPTRRSVLAMLGAAPLAAGGLLAAPGTAKADPRPDPALDAAIQEIMHRPEYRDARWGMAFRPVGAAAPLYAVNPDQLFVPASAVKVFIAATAYSALGPAHRFRTRVYGTGPVRGGVLRGDLVLVAGGDMLIGGRVRPDGTLALPEPDHSYGQFPGAQPAPGDPLQVIREIAGRVAARGVRRVEGSVLVDVSLFREVPEDIASGAPITVSPMMINDNLIDVTVLPGAAGQPAVLRIAPATAYIRIRNEVTTLPPGAPAPRPLRFTNDVTNPDGTHTVSLTGDIPAGGPSLFLAYSALEPARFAQIAFTEALRERGVTAETHLLATPASPHPTRNPLADHVSPPLSDQVRVMLKVSSNIHTVMWPHVVGAVAGHNSDNPKLAYEQFRRALFTRAGVDPDAPGAAQGRYSPDFFVTFLSYLTSRPYFSSYYPALPIMGRDGSLAGVQPNSPAAGHVYAKTGTGVGRFDPSTPPMVFKALAGYIRLPDRRWITFAQFMERPVGSIAEGIQLADQAAQAMGEIVTAVYTTIAAG